MSQNVIIPNTAMISVRMRADGRAVSVYQGRIELTDVEVTLGEHPLVRLGGYLLTKQGTRRKSAAFGWYFTSDDGLESDLIAAAHESLSVWIRS